MIKNTTTLINHLMMNLNKVNIAVDCTLGNGNDAINIINFLNPTKLYCFDIQDIAITKSKEKLSTLNSLVDISYINDTHANISKYIIHKVDFAIFNLGYLPGHSHKITTNYIEVIKCLNWLLLNLSTNGYIVITFYPGHESGMKESIEISNFLSKVDQKKFSIIKHEFINQKTCRPL